jgi:NAD(P)-dependent dehydrogenase (short-subunit alcohol dehydrogenase family)
MSELSIDLTHKVALVTGGAGGLGEGSVMALARSGADIVIADTDVDNANRVVAAVEALGCKALSIPTNMMDIDQIEPMVNAAVKHFGRVDIVVNNVGGGRPTAFLEQSQNSIQRHINLNLMSVFITTQLVAPIMIKAGNGGAIINVASTEALRAAPGFAVYAACKAAMVSFTKTMALELAEHNIRNFALAPDMILTPGLAPLMNAASESQQAARDRYVPNGRMGSIDEFGNVVAFLASDLASYLNGVTVPVDAGATAAAGWYRNPDNEWCLYHSDN